MRVTANAFNDSLVGQLNLLTARQYTLQREVSTGLQVSAPSDNPSAMADTLNLLNDKATQTQYSGNISILQTRANSIYNVLQSLQTISSRAGEISTLAGDSTKTQEELNSYADEVDQLIKRVVTSANTKDSVTGNYLFGGTASGSAPFTTTTDSNGNITGVTYSGNDSINKTEIASGITLSIDIPGANTSGSGARGLITDSASGADFLNHLITLRNDLRAGNTSAISSTDNANIQKDGDNIIYHISANGIAQSQLTAASSAATTNSSSLDSAISEKTSADLVSTMVQLNEAQNAYQAALQSGAKIMNLSLLDYIK